MNWRNTLLIFHRELTDQLRDRRTLFTVFVLPLLLYPVLGALMMQLANFFREQPVTVWICGAENLPQQPALLDGSQISAEYGSPASRRLLNLIVDDSLAPVLNPEAAASGTAHGTHLPFAATSELLASMRQRGADVLAIVPEPVAVNAGLLLDDSAEIILVHDSSSDQSRMAAQRWHNAVSEWQQAMLRQAFSIAREGISEPAETAVNHPQVLDCASSGSGGVNLWARLLPLMVMVWCLTGAFYPAIDLCAGEKERGTLETLLSSPALRTEIAMGKLGTVMVFSISTALLNLASMGTTAMLFFSQGAVSPAASLVQGPPPLFAILLVILATIPASAMFGAFSLAAAAFARSSKEGQYYLIPLIMVSMPLMIIPMLPAVHLELGTSLIPLTGLMLLVRGLIEGNWTQSLAFASPVLMVCVACSALAIRWVVHQFNSEEILFSPSERFALGKWLKQCFRSRDAGPAAGQAVLCGVVILILKFSSGLLLAPRGDWNSFAAQTFTVLLVTVAFPALLMAIILSRRPLQTLLLRLSPIRHIVAAFVLAICLNPAMALFSGTVMRLYPVDEAVTEMAAGLLGIIDAAPSLPALLFVLALAPALFEELAFRGFVLSGFRSMARGPVAVLLTSLLFGLAHGVIQQSIIAFVVGLILGLIAIRSGSLIPCVIFHATHNGLAVLFSRWDQLSPQVLDGIVVRSPDGGWGVAQQPAIVMSMVAAAVLIWLLRTGGKPEEAAISTPAVFGSRTGPESPAVFGARLLRTLFPGRTTSR